MPDDRLYLRWILFGYAMIGLVVVFYSSLPILDPGSPLHRNDEGLYLTNGAQGAIFLDMRYGLFSVLVRTYFIFLKNPFWVAVIHKVIMLGVFLMFLPALVRRYGLLVFTFLFFSFIFLDSYFLRDSLIFLCTLLAASLACSDRSIRGSLPLVPLMLTRPQAMLLFLRPWVTLILVFGFMQYMRGQYAIGQTRDNGMQTLIHVPFWEDVLHLALITLSNLNPLMAAPFLWEQADYLRVVLLVIASIAMFAVFEQMVLALWWRAYRNAYTLRLWTGMLGLLVLYGSIGSPSDKRVFIALFSPFLIYIQPLLLQWRNLACLIAVWLAMLDIRTILT